MDVFETGVRDSFTKHRGPVTSVAQVGTTQNVVTSAYDGAVAMFDLNNGSARLLGYHNHLVNRIVVNKEGTKAASCSSDYTIRIWNLQTCEVEKILCGHSDDVEDFGFVSEHVGVSASRDQRILVWDLTTGAIENVLEGHEKDVLSLAYHEGKIYSSGDDKTLRVWDLQTGQILNMWGPFEVETDTCAIDVHHNRVILGCDDGYIRVFDIENGLLLSEIQAHRSGIKKVSISPVSGDILSAAYDQQLLIWDAESFELKLWLENYPTKWERSLTWSTNGETVLAGTFDGTVLAWDVLTGKFLQEVGNEGDVKGNPCFNDVAVTDNGELALVSDDGYIRLKKITRESVLSEAFEPVSGRFLMNGVSINEKYNLVVGGAHNQKLHIFTNANGNLCDGKEVWIGEGPINTIRISEHPGYEGESFVGCYSGAIVRVGRDGSIKGHLRVHDGAVKALRLHPKKTLGLSCSAAGELLSWTYEGEVLHRYLGHTAIINDTDMDPTGKFFASVSRDFTLKVYEFFTGRLLHSFSLGRRSLKSVCFYDEDTIVVGDYWGHLVRVQLSKGDVLRRKIAGNGISSLARMNNQIVAVSYDGGIYFVNPYELTNLKTIKEMEQKVLQAR
ncbi:WD40 repeat domain-containing protein [Effusibacillus pohliae]|uniref:WD40 repeat domain-containing protein n=1 Tax=Effusibacillus pohliae TaxID=232270 RepID=UPI00035E61C6|nr:WD40 repeat domain-containing protein [Effusibacillus pohliae]